MSGSELRLSPRGMEEGPGQTEGSHRRLIQGKFNRRWMCVVGDRRSQE